MYKIPLFKLNFDKKEEEAALKTIQSRWISTGPKCKEFEDMFSCEINVRHSLTTSSCTGSLHMAVVALGIKQGDEVIVPSLTFAATVNVVKYVGATPIFADVVGYHNLTIDPLDIEKKITSKTKAIIVMHYGGYACEMGAIMKIARKHNLSVIEDSSHAPLSEYDNQKVGGIGDIGTFSFFSNKNVSTGEGGMIVTNNDELYERLKLIRSHGMTTLSFERAKGHSTSYDVVDMGFNYRMDDIRASIGIEQFKKLPNDLNKRVYVRNKYIELLKDIPGIIVPFIKHTHFTSNYIFVIVLENIDKTRDFVREELAKRGIQTSVHYPAVHLFSIYKTDFIKLPKTEYLSENLITLPMYSGLKEEEIEYVVDSLKDIIC